MGAQDAGKKRVFYTAEEQFIKPIPFKIYELGNKFVGTPEHTHNYLQIWYVMSGSCEHYINGICRRLVKGDLFVLPPYVVHMIKPIQNTEVWIIGCEFLPGFINENITSEEMRSSLFDFAYLEPFLVSADIVKPRLNITGEKQIVVEQLLEEMLHEYINEEKYYDITIKANLLKLLAVIAREYERSESIESREIFNRYRDAVNNAIRYINENFTERIYIQDVCRIAMISQSYFSYIFKQITGKTFIEYINDLRIRKAADLLADTQKSVTDICYMTGFNNPGYFARTFKRSTGLSPREYRSFIVG